MVSIIPLSIAQRRLDTGNAPQYPQGSPIGGAMQGLGDQLSAVAERYQRMKDQQEAFDAELARRRFNGEIAQAEDEATANAPADGAGLHEAMYGQVDPRTSRVVKPGLFDMLFDDALPNMPESQRANFARQKEAMRAAGSLRMAAQQLQRRKDYEQAQVDTVLKTSAIAIGRANPDDPVTFEAARQEGLDLIDKMGLDPGIRQQKVRDWFSTAAKARFEALIAKDPKRALEMFGVEAPVSGRDAAGDTAQAAGSSISGGSKAAGKDDRVGKRAPAPDPMATKAATDHLADLSPNDVRRLIDQAHAATTARLIEARTSIALASQNAPDALANTGSYSGTMPGPADFAAVYGAEDGGKQYQDFSLKMDVGRQAFGMRTMPTHAAHALVIGLRNAQEDESHHDLLARAARQNLEARAADPGGYVRRIFPNIHAAWNDASKNADYQGAITRSVAAQQQLGIDGIQPLPNSIADDVARSMIEEYVASGKIGKIEDFIPGISKDRLSEFPIISQILISSLLTGL